MRFYVFNEKLKVQTWCRDSHHVIDTLWDMHPRQANIEQSKALTLFLEDGKPGQFYRFDHVLIIRMEAP